MTDARDEDLADDRPPYAPGESGDDPASMPGLPEMPRWPAAVSATKRGGDFIVVFFTLSALLMLGLLVVACSGGSPVVLILLGAFAFFIAFHYLLWGWWLGRSIQRRAEEDENG